MQPYRLEMGTSLPISANKNLYEFWKKKLTKALNDELETDELFLNLASNEYFSAVDAKALKVPVITPGFQPPSKEETNQKILQHMSNNKPIPKIGNI